MVHLFIPLDVPLAALIATEDSIWQVEYNIDESTGHESWKILETLEIPDATALDVDILENKIYWINFNEKVSTILW